MRVRLLATVALAAAALLVSTAHGAGSPAIFTFAGGADHGFSGDGLTATRATLNGPGDVTVAPDGSIAVADTIDQRVRRIDSSNRITTIAGTGARGFAGDGGPATAATFQDPAALAYGAAGELYVADTGNNRIRVIRPDGTIATAAGSAEQGSSGDGGPATAAELNSPAGVAVSSGNQLVFSDTGNNRIRIVHPDGTIATLAGTGTPGFAGDGGPARSAQFDGPMGLAFDSTGGLLVADSGNNRVRRIGPDGIVTTVAGNGDTGSTGDLGPATAARLNFPVDVAGAPQGGFYVVEQGGNRVRRVNSAGTITRVAGTGATRFGGDGRDATRSDLNAPRAVALASATELLIADSDNNRIRFITVPGQSSRLALASLKQTVRAPLRKRFVRVHGHRVRTLVVGNVPLPFRVTKAGKLSLRITHRRGRYVTTIAFAVHAGTGAVHLPKRLRSGSRRLTKSHYVVRMTASSGGATASSLLALVVK